MDDNSIIPLNDVLNSSQNESCNNIISNYNNDNDKLVFNKFYGVKPMYYSLNYKNRLNDIPDYIVNKIRNEKDSNWKDDELINSDCFIPYIFKASSEIKRDSNNDLIFEACPYLTCCCDDIKSSQCISVNCKFKYSKGLNVNESRFKDGLECFDIPSTLLNTIEKREKIKIKNKKKKEDEDNRLKEESREILLFNQNRIRQNRIDYINRQNGYRVINNPFPNAHPILIPNGNNLIIRNMNNANNVNNANNLNNMNNANNNVNNNAINNNNNANQNIGNGNGNAPLVLTFNMLQQYFRMRQYRERLEKQEKNEPNRKFKDS